MHDVKMQIALEKASKKFRRTNALAKVDFTTQPGEIVAVVGLNGAGKSTLLRAMAGLLKLDHGRLLYGDEPFNRSDLDRRREVLFVPDIPILFPEFSILRNVGVYLRQYRREDQPDIEKKIAKLFDEFDLSEKLESFPESLSRGQLYKAGLIALFAVNPAVWLLDEPFASGMDAWGIARFREHAEQVRVDGRSIVYTTQMVDLACNFSDRICVIVDGNAIVFESGDALRQSTDPRLKKLLAC